MVSAFGSLERQTFFKKDKELQELLIKTCCTTRERCITKVEKRVSVFGSTERRQFNNH